MRRLLRGLGTAFSERMREFGERGAATAEYAIVIMAMIAHKKRTG